MGEFEMRKIEKSNKVSKHEVLKRIRTEIQMNEEGCWTAEELVTETQVAGLFSRFLKESKWKSIENNNVAKDADDTEENRDDSEALDFEDHNESDEEKDESNAAEFVQRKAGLTEAMHNELTI